MGAYDFIFCSYSVYTPLYAFNKCYKMVWEFLCLDHPSRHRYWD